MRSLPDAAALLKIARDGLLNELLPHLPKEHHYTALMAANALAISMREISADDGQHKAEAALLHELYGQAAADEGVDAFAAHLARDFRAGRFDDRLNDAGELLMAEVRARLSISNPKYLKQAGLN
ncbi:DUF6285 domain-containing protein [Zoogloea sp.]|uniref:DUF6285 domain-containing protein n=1 Tax=Zoogloea sp. TaxID=49181 RepID=UPI00262CCB71|nr:DUF6285 domain-containing protein [Zoogloea sp.]MDD3352973.1 DUF6285 domain-containing protein [Zoogloea sp.]